MWNDGFPRAAEGRVGAAEVPARGDGYDEPSREDKDQWDALEWDDDGNACPNRVEAEAVNKWPFNKDTGTRSWNI